MPVNQEQYPDIKESGENYRAFLLRRWREPGAGPEGRPVWRFALVEAGDESDKRGFASPEDLVDYLQGELGDNGL